MPTTTNPPRARRSSRALRTGLGTLAAGAALLALAGTADAASSCTYAPTTKRVTLFADREAPGTQSRSSR